MPKILIVDDEAPIIDVLSYNLKQAHYQVLVAWDGAQALDVARRARPDLIILDLMLPKLDGIEVWQGPRRHSSVEVGRLAAHRALRHHAVEGWGCR